MRLDKDMESESFTGGFHYSHIRTEHLGASNYTLVTIALDVTGSLKGFESDLSNCLTTAIESCKKSPRSENLLVRVIFFSSSFAGGINELHGFKSLADIDLKDYQNISTGGGTPLFDAAFSAIGATNAYAEKLHADDFESNGIVFIITDGDDNESSMTPSLIRKEVEKGVKSEAIESNLAILIGVNAAQYRSYLERFQIEAKLDKFIDAGDATPGKLAKLAEFVSQSVSSQSQAMGTGGPSQDISATI